MCSSFRRKCLLSLNTQYNRVHSMASKESIITGAMLILITYTLGLSLVSQASPATQTSKTLSSTGNIQTIGVGVYSDYQCNTFLSSIPWGTLEPGESQSVICYIRNEGNSPSTLSMYTSNWNPSTAEDYLTLSWNYNGQSINVDASVQVTFTLSVDESIEGVTNFSFDITIVGTS
jgi:hypothetical protein